MELNSFLGKYQVYPNKIDEYPILWNKFFSNDKKLVVEIGFGGGEFLVELAKAKQDFNYIGIENSLTSCHKIQKKIYRNNLDNVRIIFEDAKFALREFFEDDSVNKVIVNFPCPWPKRKHKKRRLFDDNFIKTLSCVLEKGGEFILTTDVLRYATQVKFDFESDGSFKTSEIVEDFQLPFKTKYQNKWEKEGRKKYLFKAVKSNRKEIKRFLRGANNLPHKKISNPDFTKLKTLVGLKSTLDNSTFIIKDLYTKVNNPEYLLKVFSDDEGFEQSYFISIVKTNNEWLVKLDDIIKVYRTPAVKESVQFIAQEIETDV
ncbi:hypothetical protein PW5551_07400 [Petrotoga sp. 9PW.55.5.1]|nr:hypothetical protein PW5551_07400 [Petrotoga sp. 9PW.55.5.1]